MATPTDYEKYIRTPELLGLQKTAEELSCHDEMQFQIVHQVAELWMKLVAHEARRVVALLDSDDLAPVPLTFERMNRALRLIVTQLDMMDTMSPRDYMTIRQVLGQGSGQESPGFKTLLRIPGEIMWPAFERMLARKKLTVRDLYEDHERLFPLYAIAEGYTDYDQTLQLWRLRHLLMVYRIIGAGTPSLKGKHSELLEKGAKQRFFPELWEVRDQVFQAWSEAYARGERPGRL